MPTLDTPPHGDKDGISDVFDLWVEDITPDTGLDIWVEDNRPDIAYPDVADASYADGWNWDWMMDCSEVPHLTDAPTWPDGGWPGDIPWGDGGWVWPDVMYLNDSFNIPGGDLVNWDGKPIEPPCDDWGGECACKSDEDCAWGWSCVELPSPPWIPGVNMCVYIVDTVCMPCNEDKDCVNSFGVVVGECRDYGGPGKYCVVPCDEEEDCPGDSACQEDPEGNYDSICMPAEDCWCSPLAEELNAWTWCDVEVEPGQCPPLQECVLDEGLTECYSPEPGVEECDGGDNDCDGEVDEAGAEGCTDFYYDGDEDGFGGEAQCLCEALEGWLEDDGDCNDEDAGINPLAEEICDGIDNNCDGTKDEQFSDFDFDGEADCVDDDIDGDGVPNDLDDCPLDPDFGIDAPDLDQDGEADCVDNDDDGDGSPDDEDCAPLDPLIFLGADEECDTLDNDCDGVVDEVDALGCQEYFPDGDEDGFGVGQVGKCLCEPEWPYLADKTGDCNDGDPTIYPEAEELCNGKDDDCDGEKDEEDAKGCKKWYVDEDGDGMGGEDNKCLCGPSFPYLAKGGGDCDDSNADVNPFEVEVCNGVDDNCNDQIDEEGAQGCTNYKKDNDEDGWGVSFPMKCLCEPEYPFTAEQSGDCDDNNADAAPGEEEECNGFDDDCDGKKDEEDAIGCQVYFLDGDKDGYGLDGLEKCICNTFGFYTAEAGGDCNDNDGEIHPGVEELCDGKDNNCDELIDMFPDKACYAASPSGECKGMLMCTPDGNTKCSAEEPGLESCDGLDNDCNGLVDDSPDGGQLIDDCYTGPDGTQNVGVCAGGQWSCANGIWGVCEGQIVPQYELCDAIDKNCNGIVDDG